MILGDLFDSFDVNPLDFYQTYVILKDWLTANPDNYLYLVAGNHDLSKTSTTVSSFELLCKFLAGMQTIVILEPTYTPYGYVIPHLPNQTLFDEALTKVPSCQNLFLHVNYDNHFAAQSDQSLNLSKEQAEWLPVQRIIIAHEHNMRTHGKVIIPGNQIASSVSDWLSSDTKWYVRLYAKECQLISCRYRASEFVEVDWKELETANANFIRVTGRVKPEEANLVVTALAKFRAVSQAFVISSAVEVEGEGSADMFAASLESVQAFDVLKALSVHLTTDQMKKVQELND